jgi:hypothetical protein
VLTPLVAGVVLLVAAVLPVAAQESPAPAASTPPGASAAPASAAPATSAQPAATESQAPAATPRPPRAGPRWERGTPAGAARGFALHDVIAGGPGFIAVGGGRARRENADPRALIWLSEDGRRWQAAPLFGDAGTGVLRAITATSDGFVAVGNACCPDQAAVWRSADGIVWERIPTTDTLAGASMADVVSVDDGLVAVGCQATLECSGGRVWRSADGGVTWEVVADVTMIPFSIAATPDGFVMTGTDSDIGGRGATASSPDGVTWTISVAERRPGSLNDAQPFGDTVLVAGAETSGNADRQRGARQRGVLLTGGTTWEVVRSARFQGASFESIGTGEGAVILVGSRREEGVTVPFSLWSSDLDTFLRGRFPRPNESDGATVNSAAFAADGATAVAVGVTADDRPVAWFSRPRASS